MKFPKVDKYWVDDNGFFHKLKDKKRPLQKSTVVHCVDIKGVLYWLKSQYHGYYTMDNITRKRIDKVFKELVYENGS